jgi:hypothetical protein
MPRKGKKFKNGGKPTPDYRDGLYSKQPDPSNLSTAAAVIPSPETPKTAAVIPSPTTPEKAAVNPSPKTPKKPGVIPSHETAKRPETKSTKATALKAQAAANKINQIAAMEKGNRSNTTYRLSTSDSVQEQKTKTTEIVQAPKPLLLPELQLEQDPVVNELEQSLPVLDKNVTVLELKDDIDDIDEFQMSEQEMKRLRGKIKSHIKSGGKRTKRV